MEQTRPAEIQDVLTKNEIITLITHEEKLQVSSYLTYNWIFLLNFYKYMVSARRV